MITLKLPDGSTRQVAPGTRPREVAESIGKRLAKDAIAAKVNGAIVDLERELPGGHTKNLFLKDKKDRLFLVVALGHAQIDLKTLHKRLGSDRLSFGKPELLMEVLGVPPGSVTPFALINDRAQRVTVILDADMMRHERLNFHPLENTATTNIAREDLARFIRSCGHQPSVVAVAQSD